MSPDNFQKISQGIDKAKSIVKAATQFRIPSRNNTSEEERNANLRLVSESQIGLDESYDLDK